MDFIVFRQVNCIIWRLIIFFALGQKTNMCLDIMSVQLQRLIVRIGVIKKVFAVKHVIQQQVGI